MAVHLKYRLNGRVWRTGLRLVAILSLLGIGGLAGVAQVFAGSYNSTFTGYAYGNVDGASGNPIEQGDFANHAAGTCNDPSGNWVWGTQITVNNPSSITLYDGNGNGTAYSTFSLEDNGDPSCAEPNYWADIYFGKYATYQEWYNGCPCSGSPSPGYCLNTYQSNCQDAINFGAPNVSYTGP